MSTLHIGQRIKELREAKGRPHDPHPTPQLNTLRATERELLEAA